MNGDNHNTQTENFAWAEVCLNKIKEWYRGSTLSVEDGFKVIDEDNDGYISEKDLHCFLKEKLKYQERELTSVRLQKLMKIMDCYKHGRITFIDWTKLIN